MSWPDDTRWSPCPRCAGNRWNMDLFCDAGVGESGTCLGCGFKANNMEFFTLGCRLGELKRMAGKVNDVDD